MTLRAIVGLLGLNVFILGLGAVVLWGFRGWRSWLELARLGGVAYLVGVAALAALMTVELVLGVPFGLPSVLVTGAGLAAAAVLSGLSLGQKAPARPSFNWTLPRLSALASVVLAALVLYFEALFRSARLAGMDEWDAWWCWTYRAKGIFYFAALDQQVFSAPRCPGYPPGFSAIEAAGFQAMGSADTVTVHLQYWLLTLGFTAAVGGLLATRVRHAILLPFLLLMLLMPSVTARVTDGRADLPLAYFVAGGTLLVILWLDDRQLWRLPAACVLFAGALVTKREGLLLVAIALVAGLAASFRERRWAWPRLVACAVAAVALTLPWRLWLAFEGVDTGAPPRGYFGVLDDLDRALPSLWLVARTFFDYDLWLLVPMLGVAATALSFRSRGRQLGVFAAIFVATSILGCSWAIWSEPDLELTQDYGLNPVVRLVGGPTLVLAALTPILLERGWGASVGSRTAGPGPGRLQTLIAWGVILIALLGYPGSMVLGYSGFRLPGGLPSFPSPGDCVRRLEDGEPVRVVLGYAESVRAANVLRRQAVGAGLRSVQVAQDGCGRLRVFLSGARSLVAARETARAAAAAGLEATLERGQEP